MIGSAISWTSWFLPADWPVGPEFEERQKFIHPKCEDKLRFPPSRRLRSLRVWTDELLLEVLAHPGLKVHSNSEAAGSGRMFLQTASLRVSTWLFGGSKKADVFI